MNSITDLEYPENEKLLIIELQKLFDEAYEYGKHISFKKPGYTYNDLTTDGFFPYYLSQNIKVLFIGLEHYGFLEKQNYIDSMYQAYKNGSVNNNQFNYLMYYISYAFNNSFPDWHSIPVINNKTFATEEGVSFAFMNISKFTNDTDSSKADKELINEFAIVYSNDNIRLLQRQIEILNPDIIITMNINEYTDIKYLGVCDFRCCDDGKVSIYDYKLLNRNIPLFDTYHFSKRGMNEILELYIPLKNAYNKYQRGCV